MFILSLTYVIIPNVSILNSYIKVISQIGVLGFMSESIGDKIHFINFLLLNITFMFDSKRFLKMYNSKIILFVCLNNLI